MEIKVDFVVSLSDDTKSFISDTLEKVLGNEDDQEEQDAPLENKPKRRRSKKSDAAPSIQAGVGNIVAKGVTCVEQPGEQKAPEKPVIPEQPTAQSPSPSNPAYHIDPNTPNAAPTPTPATPVTQAAPMIPAYPASGDKTEILTVLLDLSRPLVRGAHMQDILAKLQSMHCNAIAQIPEENMLEFYNFLVGLTLA